MPLRSRDFESRPTCPQPIPCIAVAYRRFATGQCYGRGLKVSRRAGAAPPRRSPGEGGRRKREGGDVPAFSFLLPASFVPAQLLPLPSQRLRPLSGQRLGKRLVALELARPLAAALGDVPVAEGAAAGAE